MQRRAASYVRSWIIRASACGLVLAAPIDPVNADSRQLCVQACADEIAACVSTCSAYGDDGVFSRACRRAVYKRCRREGAQVCTPPPGTDPCRVTGCSGQLCADHGIATTCEWRGEYTCYRDARCERQADGSCNWTMTDELERCLASFE
jgi:hypothetical protein